jgi:hypothetical protein
MKKNIIRFTLCAILFQLCVSAEAQQPKKVLPVFTGMTK